MSKFLPLTLLSACSLLSSCATVSDAKTSEPFATAALFTSDGTPAGTATITEVGDRLDVLVTAEGLPPGPHGTHLHTIGSCDAPDFTSAGGHLNPYGKMHGSLNAQGSHVGDLPNLLASDDGNGTLTFQLEGTRAALEPILLDSDGTALVIHAGADDYRSDPAGAAGPRLVCGVFKSAG